jgi:hypothetical protein
VAKFNQQNIPFLPKEQTVDGISHTVQYRSLGGDMNIDDSTNFATGNPTISMDETYGLPGQGSKPDFVWVRALQTAYRIVGYVASTYAENVEITVPGTGTKTTFRVVRENPTSEFKVNDICVTRESATVEPFIELAFLKANHSTVARPEYAKIVIDSIRKIQTVMVPVP